MEAQLSMMMLPSGLFTENGTLQQDPTVLQGAQMPTQFSAPFMMVPSMGMAPAGFQMAPAGQAPVQYFLQPMAAAPQPQQIMLVPGPMMQPVPQPQTLVSLKPAIPPSPFECAPSASTTLTTIPQGAFTFDVSGAQQAVPVQMQQFTPVTFEPAANGPAGSSGNKQNSEGSRQGEGAQDGKQGQSGTPVAGAQQFQQITYLPQSAMPQQPAGVNLMTTTVAVDQQGLQQPVQQHVSPFQVQLVPAGQVGQPLPLPALPVAPLPMVASPPPQDAAATSKPSQPGGGGPGTHANGMIRGNPFPSFAEYEKRYGNSAKCTRGDCAADVNKPCKEHRCACCKINRQIIGSSRQGWCGPCAKREVVNGLVFVRCGRCKAEMLEATYQAHLKQNVAINDNKGNRITGRCRDVNREIVETDKGRRCGKCTNMRPVTFYASEDTNCSCNIHNIHSLKVLYQQQEREGGTQPTSIPQAKAGATLAASETQEDKARQAILGTGQTGRVSQGGARMVKATSPGNKAAQDHVNSLLASGVQGLQQHCQDLQTIMNATFVSAQTHVANIIAALEQCKARGVAGADTTLAAVGKAGYRAEDAARSLEDLAKRVRTVTATAIAMGSLAPSNATATANGGGNDNRQAPSPFLIVHKNSGDARGGPNGVAQPKQEPNEQPVQYAALPMADGSLGPPMVDLSTLPSQRDAGINGQAPPFTVSGAGGVFQVQPSPADGTGRKRSADEVDLQPPPAKHLQVDPSNGAEPTTNGSHAYPFPNFEARKLQGGSQITVPAQSPRSTGNGAEDTAGKDGQEQGVRDPSPLPSAGLSELLMTLPSQMF